MDYMTLKDASVKWGISPRMINYYCSAGRILGAEKIGNTWFLPKDSGKPNDNRRKKQKTK